MYFVNDKKSDLPHNFFIEFPPYVAAAVWLLNVFNVLYDTVKI